MDEPPLVFMDCFGRKVPIDGTDTYLNNPQVMREGLFGDENIVRQKIEEIKSIKDKKIHTESGECIIRSTYCPNSSREMRPPEVLRLSESGYQYDQLTSDRSFRVLTLLPATEEECPIECTIAEYSLDTSPDFEAVSYVWGSETTGDTITLNTKDNFHVTKNLGQLLRSFRRSDSERQLWIDAICINQTDTSERSHQVGLMEVIYQCAQEVAVWLGPIKPEYHFIWKCIWEFEDVVSGRRRKPRSTTKWRVEEFVNLDPRLPHGTHPICSTPTLFYDFSEVEMDEERYMDLAYSVSHMLAQKHLSAFHKCQNRHSDEVVNGVPPPPFTIVFEANKDKDGNPIEANGFILASGPALLVFSGLLSLMLNPWWRRVWVLQEVALASRVHVYMGQASISWTSLRDMISVFLVMADTERYIRDNIAEFSCVNEISLITIFSHAARPFFLFSNPSYTPSLPELLLITGGFSASDCRDYIYSLRGLLPADDPVRDLIKPDYKTISYEQLLTTIAQYLLQQDGTLDLLAAKGTLEAHVPSWVPTWRGKGPKKDFIDTAMNVLSNGGNILSISLGKYSPYSIRHPISCKYQKVGANIYNASSLPLPDEWPSSPSSPSAYSFHFPAGLDVLAIYGVRITTLFALAPPLRPNADLTKIEDDPVDESVEPPPLWYEWMALGEADSDAVYPFQPHEAAYEHLQRDAFVRTILLDRAFGTRPKARREKEEVEAKDDADEDEKEDADNALLRITPDWQPALPTSPSMHSWYHVLTSCAVSLTKTQTLEHSAGRCLFRSVDGHIGIAPPDARRGDVVVVAYGGRVPLCLRKGKDRWVFIGECYVHGFMDGEAIRGLEERKEEPEEFWLI